MAPQELCPKAVAWGAARMTQDPDIARAKLDVDECLSHRTPRGKREKLLHSLAET